MSKPNIKLAASMLGTPYHAVAMNTISAADRDKLAAFPAMLEALRKIAAAGPETDPHDDEDYDDQEGAYGAGIDAANWECASIARAALAAAGETA